MFGTSNQRVSKFVTLSTVGNRLKMSNSLLILHSTMPKSHTNRGALLTSNLPQLQNLIKRDPKAYREEFLQQWTHYQSILRIFQLNPTEHAQHFRELTSFISQVTNHPYCLGSRFCCGFAPKLVFLFHENRTS